mmetsp:Transcript_15501/g.37518  ORF Transcript_15501/g.37518 Transcript_15501/m.37518 type:complete len:213 (+) Transcript_15501:855-1493(+)
MARDGEGVKEVFEVGRDENEKNAKEVEEREEEQEEEQVDDDDDALIRRPPQRLTLMIGWHGPDSAPPPLPKNSKTTSASRQMGPLMEAPDPAVPCDCDCEEEGEECEHHCCPEWARVDLRPRHRPGFWDGSQSNDGGGVRLKPTSPGSGSGSGFIGPFTPVWEPVRVDTRAGPSSAFTSSQFSPHPSAPPLGLRYFLTHDSQLEELYTFELG